MNKDIIEIQHSGIPINIYESEYSTKKITISVNGSGVNSTRNEWNRLIKQLRHRGFTDHVATFSFRNRTDDLIEDKKDQYILGDEIIDLVKVLEALCENMPDAEINLICTSQGGYSTSWVSTVTKFAPKIKNIVYLDPVDHELSEHNKLVEDVVTFSGADDFLPEGPLASEMLQWLELNPQVKVHVANFILKNYSSSGYLERDNVNRGINKKDGHSRLNDQMVEDLYSKNTPEQNQGTYQSVGNIPHAFMRDGVIGNNVQNVANLILRFLKES